MTIHEQVLDWEINEGVSLFDAIGLKADSLVLDYGCGFGHYTIAAANVLKGTGCVYGVDIDKQVMKYLNQKIVDDKLENVELQIGNEDYTLDFNDEYFDMILYYDMFHGRGTHRFTMIEEAMRTLKPGGILSVLPFHLSNFRDREGNKKKYSYKSVAKEICEYGFKELNEVEDRGIHFEKYHSPHYIKKGGVTFESLERGTILNFVKE